MHARSETTTVSDKVHSNSSYASNHYVDELSKQVDRKSKRAFLKDLEEIESNIESAMEIVNDSTRKNKDWSLIQAFCQNICGAVLVFVEATDWLHGVYSLADVKNEKIDGANVRLLESWTVVAERLADTLKKTTSVYTTYDDSLGMGNGDCSVSNLFLNLKRYKYNERPYFADSLRNAAIILLRNDQLNLAYRYALIAAIEAIWDQYRYDREDVLEALAEIPNCFWRKHEYRNYVEYTIKTLDWLYEFYSTWGLQYDAYLYIQHFHLELLESFEEITDVTRQKVVEYWKRVVKILVEPLQGGVIFDDFLLSHLIEILTKSDRYDEAFEIVSARIDTLVVDGKNVLERGQLKLDELLYNMQGLAKIGFDLKEQNVVSLKKNLDMMKSNLLENKVSELADQLGFTEKEEREWVFQSQELYKFIKDKKTQTVEVDVCQTQAKHILGRERKIIFLAECRYKKRPATRRDVEFFFYKSKDLLEQQKELSKRYPKKLTPKIGELWFVSINGFHENAMPIILKIDGCPLKLVDGNELNDILSEHNLSRVPII